MLKSRKIKYLIGRFLAKELGLWASCYCAAAVWILVLTMKHISWILALILLPFAIFGFFYIGAISAKYVTKKEKDELERQNRADSISVDLFWKNFFGG